VSPETLGRRECEEGGCSKQAVSGGTPHCIAHGGGKRCQHTGCTKSAIRNIASHMAGAGAARTRAAPRQLKAAHTAAWRMGAAGAARRRAAPSQSLELPAVCTAGYVSSASSPTMRRTIHSNSVARPSRPKPRVGSCENSSGDGGWRARSHPQASNRSDVQRVYNIHNLHRCKASHMCNFQLTSTSRDKQQRGLAGPSQWYPRHCSQYGGRISHKAGIARSTVAASLIRPALLAVRWPHLSSGRHCSQYGGRISHQAAIARSTVVASLTRPALLAVRWPHLSSGRHCSQYGGRISHQADIVIRSLFGGRISH
jgi:hypothetical protein